MSANADEPLAFPFARKETYHPASEYAFLRHNCSIAQVRLYDDQRAWLLLRREDCCAALSSSSLSADRRHPGYPEIHPGGLRAKEQERPTFVNLDDPAHAEQRALVEPWFTQEAVQSYRHMIEKVVNDQLDELTELYGEHASTPVDFIDEFLVTIPTQIMFRILGVPERDYSALARENEIRISTSRTAAETSNKRLMSYMDRFVESQIRQPAAGLVEEFVESQIRQPDEGLVAELVRTHVKDGTLDKEGLVQLSFLLLVAGNAAVINAAALGIITLLAHPDQLAELEQQPQIAPKVVQEVLRYHTVSALNCRRAIKENVRIAGHHFKQNEGVICAVQSADRDEVHFTNPDNFDIHRPVQSPADTMAFGWGAHRCQAEWLARLELEILLTRLFERLPGLRLAVPENAMDYTAPTQNIGIVEMPVVW